MHYVKVLFYFCFKTLLKLQKHSYLILSCCCCCCCNYLLSFLQRKITLCGLLWQQFVKLDFLSRFHEESNGAECGDSFLLSFQPFPAYKVGSVPTSAACVLAHFAVPWTARTHPKPRAQCGRALKTNERDCANAPNTQSPMRMRSMAKKRDSVNTAKA